ncbi:dihydrofolate reductase-like [Zophobas morio]|uniref:dihydrofolate reductase-like n=1 Tax=Zophobas morio TaxID=2755281 RepID=UPI003083C582
MRTFSIIVALTSEGGIGYNNSIPWKLKGDIKFFKEKTSSTLDKTKRNAVVMGRHTWFSIPEKFRPLPGRLNVIISSTLDSNELPSEHSVVCRDFSSALKLLSTDPYCIQIENVFVIGGSLLYKEALAMPQCTALYITRVYGKFHCDRFFPRIDFSLFKLPQSYDNSKENSNAPAVLLRSSEDGVNYEIYKLIRVNIKRY